MNRYRCRTYGWDFVCDLDLSEIVFCPVCGRYSCIEIIEPEARPGNDNLERELIDELSRALGL